MDDTNPRRHHYLEGGMPPDIRMLIDARADDVYARRSQPGFGGYLVCLGTVIAWREELLAAGVRVEQLGRGTDNRAWHTGGGYLRSGDAEPSDHQWLAVGEGLWLFDPTASQLADDGAPDLDRYITFEGLPFPEWRQAHLHGAAPDTGENDVTPEDFAEIARVSVVEGVAGGRSRAASVAYTARAAPVRMSIGIPMAAAIFLRDHFVCRYCGRRTVLLSILELLARLYPAEIPYLNSHLPAGQTHPAFTQLTASVDHVEPVALGGGRDPGNLVTACWPCNIAKSEFDLRFLGWHVRDIEDVAWAGLSEYYVPLWHLAGEPDPRRHLRWIRALGLPVQR